MKETLIASLGEWRDLRRTPRLFTPLNPYNPTQCHWTHAFRVSGEPDGDGPFESVGADVLNACAAWDKLGTFAERNGPQGDGWHKIPCDYGEKFYGIFSNAGTFTVHYFPLSRTWNIGLPFGAESEDFALMTPFKSWLDARRTVKKIAEQFAERNARRERKCPAPASESQKTSISTSPVVPSATTTAFANAYGLVSPLASDGPEARGWVPKRGLGCTWIKEQVQLWSESDGTWWAAKDPNHETGHEHRMLGPSGFMDFLPGGKAYRFPDWQKIDALLFPAHEWAVGDLLECLDVGKPGWFGHGKILPFKALSKHCSEECAELDWGQGMIWYWPVRALRLIKAAERTTK